jgi:hypothetical protein
MPIKAENKTIGINRFIKNIHAIETIKIKILNKILTITTGSCTPTLGRAPLVRDLDFILLLRKVSIVGSSTGAIV